MIDSQKDISKRRISTGHFEMNEWISEEKQRVLAEQYLLPWAESLGRGAAILDLAGGLGIESQELSDQGFKVTLQDISPSLLEHSEHQRKVLADGLRLPYADGSFSGVVFKDAWIFFPPREREILLREIKRVLKSGGSLFLLSQIGQNIRVHYVPKGSQLAQKDSLSSWDEFITFLDKIQKYNDLVVSIEYLSTVDDVQQYAEQLGFNFHVIHQYRFDDPVAQENRWVQRSGYIVELQKP